MIIKKKSEVILQAGIISFPFENCSKYYITQKIEQYKFIITQKTTM